MMQSIDLWLCPWCFVAPYTPPRTHKCRKNADTLKNTVLSDAISSQIEDKIEALIDKKLQGILQSNPQIDEKLSSLETKMDKILSNPTPTPQGEGSNRASYTPPPPEIQPSTDDCPIDVSHIKHVESLQKNYLDADSLGDLKAFLASVNYSSKDGRDTATFGSEYKYMGSDEKPQPMTPVLQNVLDRLNETTMTNEDHQKRYKLNSCHIVRYTNNKSWLPEHSDNEPWIHPESKIFCLSVGGERDIIMRNTSTGEEVKLSLPNNSLYSMTRVSQDIFRHRIDPDETAENVTRYALTFRVIDWTYVNSTIMYGDSNFGKVKFGKERNQVGKATPGYRGWASHVNKIEPTKCMSYRNVVLMCGTNDMRNIGKENTDQEAIENDIHDVYRLYKLKIKQIRELNKNCKIFVCPVLPSLERNLNAKIFCFNDLIFNDLAYSDYKVNIVSGFDGFYDPASRLLRRDLHNDVMGDTLHLGVKRGVPLLVRLVKQSIFSRSKSRVTSGKSYSTAAARLK